MCKQLEAVAAASPESGLLIAADRALLESVYNCVWGVTRWTHNYVS